MPDVQAKLDEAHVDLLVQPEFFVNDLVQAGRDVGARHAEGRRATTTCCGMPSREGDGAARGDGRTSSTSPPTPSRTSRVKPRSRQGAARATSSGSPTRPGSTRRRGSCRTRSARASRSPSGGRGWRRPGGRWRPARASRAPTRPWPAPCENGHVEGVFRRDIEVAVTPRFKRFRGKPSAHPRSAGPGRSRASRAPQRNVGARLARAARGGGLGGAPRRPRPRVRRGEPRRRAALVASRCRAARCEGRPAVAGGRDRLARPGHRRVERQPLGHAARRVRAPERAAARRRRARSTVGAARRGPVEARARRGHGPTPSTRPGSTSASARPTTTCRRRTSTSRALGKRGRKLDTGRRSTSPRASTTRGRRASRCRGKRVLVTWTRLPGLRLGRLLAAVGQRRQGFAKQVRVTSDADDQEELADSPDPRLSARAASR